MFFRRRPPTDDRWLRAKIWIFSIGAVLALAGMALEEDRLVAVAAVVLLVGMALRFLDRQEPSDGSTPEPGDASGEAGPPPPDEASADGVGGASGPRAAPPEPPAVS